VTSQPGICDVRVSHIDGERPAHSQALLGLLIGDEHDVVGPITHSGPPHHAAEPDYAAATRGIAMCRTSQPDRLTR
jgi:hypothetical protein